MEIKGLSLSDQLQMLKGVEPITPRSTTSVVDPAKKQDFLDFLKTQLQEANNVGLEADQKIQDTIEGKVANPHETIIAIQKADVSFRLMMSVKDQLEQAYQQIMRTSIG
jgi:flagellar hook-basal body complex protein FliE